MKDEPWRGNLSLRCQHLEQKVHDQKAEIKRLKRENARLRKAGSVLLSFVEIMSREDAQRAAAWASKILFAAAEAAKNRP